MKIEWKKELNKVTFSKSVEPEVESRETTGGVIPVDVSLLRYLNILAEPCMERFLSKSSLAADIS